MKHPANAHLHIVPPDAAFHALINAACDDYMRAHPRAGAYGTDVIRGYQRWSGADLKGKARRFSGSHMRARAAAANACHRHGLTTCPNNARLIVTARIMGQDNYGNAIVMLAD